MVLGGRPFQVGWPSKLHTWRITARAASSINTVNIFYTWFRRTTYTRVCVCLCVRAHIVYYSESYAVVIVLSCVGRGCPRHQRVRTTAGVIPFSGHSSTPPTVDVRSFHRREHCRVWRTRIFFYHPLPVSQPHTLRPVLLASFQFGWELLLA